MAIEDVHPQLRSNLWPPQTSKKSGRVWEVTRESTKHILCMSVPRCDHQGCTVGHVCFWSSSQSTGECPISLKTSSPNTVFKEISCTNPGRHGSIPFKQQAEIYAIRATLGSGQIIIQARKASASSFYHPMTREEQPAATKEYSSSTGTVYFKGGTMSGTVMTQKEVLDTAQQLAY